MTLRGSAFKCFFIFVTLLALISMSSGENGFPVKVDSNLLKTMEWRCIGPYRGGRVTAVAGVPGHPQVYYFGATGGGVWKTEDAGLTWKNISDGYFKTGSVGAIAVAESNPNVVYVGMGESSLRNDISYGDGVYKSVDGGKTWKHIGLKDSRHTRRIRIHPQDPDLVYVTVLGHAYGPNNERGIFRSRDGGTTWEKVLYIDDNTGAIDLAMDSINPRILYAAMWQVKLTPWGLYRGPRSGLYKSVDGGDTWTELKNGLPKKPKGKIGVAVSPVNPRRVWALIEAEDGGLFRSDDAGETWRLINDAYLLRFRHYYYTYVYASTQDPDTIYVLNQPVLKSRDGGETFHPVQVPHADNHDLWIAPEDNMRMINGNDGGANVSFNGGKSWSTIYNQPTAQFYHVIADNQFPYHVYGAQQDNSTVCIASRTKSSGIDITDWYPVAGGESGYIAPDPDDANISYGGSYWGVLTRYDHRIDETRDISIWPESPMGRSPADLKYRFNWTYPIMISPHDPDTIYAAHNVLLKSTNEGQSWQEISPDLTRNDKSKQQDGVVIQTYCTIFAINESPLEKDLIWAGSDDGLVHITKDGGRNWQNVTPKMMPEWSRVSIIEASPHDAATVYLAVNRFELDDFKPYIYKTIDYGKTWKLITNGIPEGAFVRVVREDPKRKGLLYAGTETGVYVSFDEGENWQSLQLNLPIVPVHNMVIKEDDLVAATHGRSFWILDDLTPLHQLKDEILSSSVYLFKPRDTYRMERSGGSRFGPLGQNPPSGAVVHFYLRDNPEQEVNLEFIDSEGNVIKSFKNERGAKKPIPLQQGMNRFDWNMRYPDARGIKGGTVLFRGNLQGPVAVPGSYQVRLTVGEKSLTESFQIKKDPRLPTTQEDFKEQFDLLISIRDNLSAIHDAVNQIYEAQNKLDDVQKRVKGLSGEKVITEKANNLKEKLYSVLKELIAPEIKSFDEFRTRIQNHPNPPAIPLKLNNRIVSIKGVVESSERKPTDQCHDNFKELAAEAEKHLNRLKEIMDKDVPAFYTLIKEHGVPEKE